MALPVTVSLDRIGGGGSLDLTPLIAQNSLTWSSVVPGGFASCSFTMSGDFRGLVKLIPFLSTVRVVGDSGRVLFEGSVEDLAPTISETSTGLKVSAYGLQNILRETSVHAVWSKRDMKWDDFSMATGGNDGTRGITSGGNHWQMTAGAYDPTNLSTSGVEIRAAQSFTPVIGEGGQAQFTTPSGIALSRILANYSVQSSAAIGTINLCIFSSDDGTNWTKDAGPAANSGSGAASNTLSHSAFVRISVNAALANAIDANTYIQLSDIRLLGVLSTEDVSGGFYGDTLIKNLLSLASLGQGVIESGSDFTIDHLDASVRRSAYDVLQEITQYYAREWAIWEDALLHWRTPQLSQPQWIIPISRLASLDLDASVQNSQKTSIVLYTEAATGRTRESSVASTDRRNPYVLTGRTKDELVSAGFPMTANTAPQLASIILNDLGFGPVPAAGTISLSGETVVQHAQGNAAKAWELRAGDNVTIPELPLADVFTQDGRGECLFHIVSAEASISTGDVTLSLDSYGSKRSDVLLARLAAVTQALGG